MDDREQHIRARAHVIWESEGRPHGRDAEHWRRAEAELASEGLPTPDEVSAIDPDPDAQHSPGPLEPEVTKPLRSSRAKKANA